MKQLYYTLRSEARARGEPVSRASMLVVRFVTALVLVVAYILHVWLSYFLRVAPVFARCAYCSGLFCTVLRRPRAGPAGAAAETATAAALRATGEPAHQVCSAV